MPRVRWVRWKEGGEEGREGGRRCRNIAQGDEERREGEENGLDAFATRALLSCLKLSGVSYCFAFLNPAFRAEKRVRVGRSRSRRRSSNKRRKERESRSIWMIVLVGGWKKEDGKEGNKDVLRRHLGACITSPLALR
jgi:hypothetical protein